jgi:hypothetical protein
MLGLYRKDGLELFTHISAAWLTQRSPETEQNMTSQGDHHFDYN